MEAEVRQAEDKISACKDLDALLEVMLTESRRLTSAEGGCIYLMEDGRLRLSWMQHQRMDPAQVHLHRYDAHALSINERSLAGYAALRREAVMVADVSRLSRDVPYAFDSTLDDRWHVKTVSVLVAPITGRDNTLTGVIQLFNSAGGAGGFSDRDRILIDLLAVCSAPEIERARIFRSFIGRMVSMTELKDPVETVSHAHRVAASACEVYEVWACKHSIPLQDRLYFRDRLRVAGMLHDVGKIAIPKTILQKPGKLTAKEFEVMKQHTLAGATILAHPQSDVEEMARDIALNHHEWWDGSGYPGHIQQVSLEKPEMGRGKKGKEIPLVARIVALADVYDALISERCYKEPWPEDKAVAQVRSESGTHFDPEIVEAFVGIHDIVRAIGQRNP